MYTTRLISCGWVSWSDLMLNLTLSAIQVYSVLGKCQGAVGWKGSFSTLGEWYANESTGCRLVSAYNSLGLSEQTAKKRAKKYTRDFLWLEALGKGLGEVGRSDYYVRDLLPLFVSYLHPVPGCSSSLSLTIE